MRGASAQVIEVRKAIDACEKKITEEVKRRTNRDKVKIRSLQVEHDKLTKSLAEVLKDNREETIDTKDNTGEVYRKEQEDAQKKKQLEFETQKLANEADAKKELEKQRKQDLNLKDD